MIQVVTIKHLSISVVFKISHNIICSILLIKFRPSQHVRLRAMRFKSRLIEGTFLRGTTFILEMKVIRGLTKYLRRVSKLLQIRRCHFDFLQGSDHINDPLGCSWLKFGFSDRCSNSLEGYVVKGCFYV